MIDFKSSSVKFIIVFLVNNSPMVAGGIRTRRQGLISGLGVSPPTPPLPRRLIAQSSVQPSRAGAYLRMSPKMDATAGWRWLLVSPIIAVYSLSHILSSDWSWIYLVASSTDHPLLSLDASVRLFTPHFIDKSDRVYKPPSYSISLGQPL